MAAAPGPEPKAAAEAEPDPGPETGETAGSGCSANACCERLLCLLKRPKLGILDDAVAVPEGGRRGKGPREGSADWGVERCVNARV